MSGKTVSTPRRDEEGRADRRTQGETISGRRPGLAASSPTALLTLGPDTLDLSPDCIKIIGLDGRLLHMNRAGCVALGIKAHEAAGREWARLLPEQIYEKANDALAEVRAGRHARFVGLSDGGAAGLRHWDNMLTPLRSATGAVEQILCVSRDITRQREMEGHVSELTTELGRQSRALLDVLRDIQGQNGPMNGARLADALEELRAPILGVKSALAHAEKLIGQAADAPPSETAPVPDRPNLTARERECLLWVALGKTAWETASILGISQRTVEFHLANAIKKLGVTNKTQAAMLALRNGII